MKTRLIHADECADLARITVAAYARLYDPTPLGPYEVELRDVESRRRDSEVYVALDEEATLMGGVTYVAGPSHALAEFRDPAACGIRMLAVDPAHEGRGAGRALVLRCVERAIEQRRERIILHSAPPMTRAQGLYRAMGFARAPDLDEFIHEVEDPTDEPLHLRAFVLTV